MARETLPLPAICRTAFEQARLQYGQVLAELGKQALAALGRDPSESWHFDADPVTGQLGGSISRELPDVPAVAKRKAK